MAKQPAAHLAPFELPSGWDAALLDTAKRLGLAAFRNDEAIAEAVRALSHTYTLGRAHLAERAGSLEAMAARLLFYLTREQAKLAGPVDELARQGRLPAGARLRVLDLGAGVGATSVGLARALAKHGVAALTITARDQDPEAVRLYEQVVPRLSALAGSTEVTAHIEQASIERPPRGPFEVITAGFVLNEALAELTVEAAAVRGAELMQQWAHALAPGGVLLVLEPALKETSRGLQAMRDVLVARGKPPFVLAPCLHANACPMLTHERDWCHAELRVALPTRYAAIAHAAGLRFEGLSYSYLVLANEPPVAASSERDELRTLRVVSNPRVSKGKRELFGCGQGGMVRLVRLDRDASDVNSAMDEAQRGDVIEVSGTEPRVDGERVGTGASVVRA